MLHLVLAVKGKSYLSVRVCISYFVDTNFIRSGQRFLHAYQHLERIGKLRHARFTNSNDLVPLVPFHGITRSYKHVGMHIRLLGVDKFAQYWLRRALDVTYPKYHDVSGVYLTILIVLLRVALFLC